MRMELIRHGLTALSVEHRYQGITDAPLSSEGRAALRAADELPARVIVTPLVRTQETADILFPGVPQIVVQGLEEMNFGRFEGRNYLEMADDPDYRAWVEGMCLGRCPGGETKDEYAVRVTAAFTQLMERARDEAWQDCVIVAHGGTQMVLLEAFATERRDYYTWQLPCGHGYRLDAAGWESQQQLAVLGEVDYTAPQNYTNETPANDTEDAQ